MTVQELFHAVQGSEISKLIGRQDHLLGAIAQIFHIAGLILVLSPILIVSLRLLGLVLRKQSVNELVKATSAYIWVGLGLLAFSGALIFLPAADHYYPNPVFWFKYVLLALALLVHLTLYRKVTQGQNTSIALARFTGVLALVLWFGVAFSGRLIGFY